MAKLVETRNNRPLLQIEKSDLDDIGREKQEGLRSLSVVLEDMERAKFPYAVKLGQVARSLVSSATHAQTSAGNGEVAILAEYTEDGRDLIRRGESFIIEHDRSKIRIGLPGGDTRTHVEFTIFSNRQRIFLALRKMPSTRGYIDPDVALTRLDEIVTRLDPQQA